MGMPKPLKEPGAVVRRHYARQNSENHLPAHTKAPNRGVQLHYYVDDDMAVAVREAAELLDMTFSEFQRQALAEKLERAVIDQRVLQEQIAKIRERNGWD